MTNMYSPTSIEWTLERVKRRIETGVEITPQVVDIGGGIIVKSGTTRVRQEAKTTEFVARSTNIRVPNIYAVLHDEEFGTSYIVEEKLPGVPLKEVLPHLDDATRTSLANELKGVCRELEGLNDKGSMGNLGNPGKFLCSVFASPEIDDGPFHTTEEFIRSIPKALDKYVPSVTDIPALDVFDFNRSPVFSHGDLVPENILVHNERISGIIDWEHGGWYPYFWNDWVGRWRFRTQFRDGKWERMVGVMTEAFPAEFQVFLRLHDLSQAYL
ncbi:kinase-like domain-containing protein [Favolaschia claudopus]|uniref:Kinase-like domain-containing protein n=1 Tax=Favolaschia claudopus TaxID=2862362 RepID=A0AAV9Z0Y4_9AGAR